MLKATNGNVLIQENNDVTAIYGSDFDESRFQLQLETLEEYCGNLGGNACIRYVTDTLRNVKVHSRLSEVFNLIADIVSLYTT